MRVRAPADRFDVGILIGEIEGISGTTPSEFSLTLSHFDRIAWLARVFSKSPLAPLLSARSLHIIPPVAIPMSCGSELIKIVKLIIVFAKEGLS